MLTLNNMVQPEVCCLGTHTLCMLLESRVIGHHAAVGECPFDNWREKLGNICTRQQRWQVDSVVDFIFSVL